MGSTGEWVKQQFLNEECGEEGERGEEWDLRGVKLMYKGD